MLEDLNKLKTEGYTQIVIPKDPDFNPDAIDFNKNLKELSINREGVFFGVEKFKVVETENHPETLGHFSSKYLIYIKAKESCIGPIKRCGIDPCTQYSQKPDGTYCFDGTTAVKVTKGALCTDPESKAKNLRPLEETIEQKNN